MRAWDGGASIFTAFLYSLSAPLLASPKNFRAKPKQAGKKEGGLGEGIFARLLTAPKARLGWERFRLSALAEGQNRKIFFSLIEKKFGGARLKECRENFSVLLSGSAGGNAGRDSVQIRLRIFLEKSSDFVQDTEPYCMLLFCPVESLLFFGVCQYFPRIFERNKNLSLPQNAVRCCKATEPSSSRGAG